MFFDIFALPLVMWKKQDRDNNSTQQQQHELKNNMDMQDKRMTRE